MTSLALDKDNTESFLWNYPERCRWLVIINYMLTNTQFDSLRAGRFHHMVMNFFTNTGTMLKLLYWSAPLISGQNNNKTNNTHQWWRHQMETFSTLLALCAGNSPVTVEFPSPRPVTRSFDVFFDLRLNKLLSKHSWGWWFETPSRSL